MKHNKCTNCNNDTFQKDGICVICKLGLTQMYAELAALSKKKNKLRLMNKRFQAEAAGALTKNRISGYNPLHTLR